MAIIHQEGCDFFTFPLCTLNEFSYSIIEYLVIQGFSCYTASNQAVGDVARAIGMDMLEVGAQLKSKLTPE